MHLWGGLGKGNVSIWEVVRDISQFISGNQSKVVLPQEGKAR